MVKEYDLIKEEVKNLMKNKYVWYNQTNYIFYINIIKSLKSFYNNLIEPL